MTCIDFLTGNLEEQLVRVWNRGSCPIVFIHIPKTGGTSLQRDLNITFPDTIHVPNVEKERHWQDAMSQLTSEKKTVVRGHLNFNHLHDLDKNGIEFRAVTYLRHPADRLVSQYIWTKSNHRKDPQKYPPPEPFHMYCERMSKNYFCDLLIGPVSNAEEAISKVANRFWFVGVSEYSHICQAVLFAAMGERYRVRLRRNQTASHADDLAEIDADCLKHALDGMQIDLSLFDFFHSKWSAKINEAVELLMKQSKLPNRD